MANSISRNPQSPELTSPLTPPPPTPSPFHPSQPQVLIVQLQSPSTLSASLHLSPWVSMASLLMAAAPLLARRCPSQPFDGPFITEQFMWLCRKNSSDRTSCLQAFGDLLTGLWLCATRLLNLMLGNLPSRVPSSSLCLPLLQLSDPLPFWSVWRLFPLQPSYRRLP